jgi:hypothetical protein
MDVYFESDRDVQSVPSEVVRTVDPTQKFVSALSLLGNGPLTGAELVGVRLATACASVLPVDGAGISVFTSDGIRIPVGASDHDASTAERLQFTVAEGPCLTVHQTGQPVVASESVLARQWPLFHQALVAHTPFRAVTSVPLQSELAEIATMDLYFQHSADALSIDMAAVDDINEHISLTLIDEVPSIGSHPRWMDSPTATRRSCVFLAIGMISVDMELSTQDALAVLRARAYATDRSIDDTAREIVDQHVPLERLHLDSD